ncbi:DUF3087 domain-containing protein [Alteromonas sediminis]|uniref:DUF3087 domain-containing protein n=1 Tax=Alteromonas sediminis TaxID=2259342 RepID=A0A3N5Z710_9ALTE|nr:DUF3087 domain-containing protein [Alteromonas sediminis]RPJ66454.1 DUF3087 domain-containing protein [Alteromonas sediminis]
MQLKKINKARYRKHLNIVIVSCIASLLVGSLGIAQLLIFLFPDQEGSHFHWNLLGVIVSAITIGAVLNKWRNHPFMAEVTYVWELKQTLNYIARKLPKLNQAAEEGDVTAMNAMQFSYAGSRFLWQLDDNTLVMDELAISQAKLDALAAKHNVTLNADRFEKQDLARF